jgi:hypothetical protein
VMRRQSDMRLSAVQLCIGNFPHLNLVLPRLFVMINQDNFIWNNLVFLVNW